MAVHLGYAHPTLAAVKILCGAGGRETPDSERVSTDWGTLQFVRALPQVVAVATEYSFAAIPRDTFLFCSECTWTHVGLYIG